MMSQTVSAEETDGITVEIETPAVDEEPPEDDPFALVESGTLDLPEVDGWECSGPVHQSETDDHSIAWSGEFTMPGFPDSKRGIVAVVSDAGSDGYGVTFTAFEEGEEHATPHPVASYDRLLTALKNVEQALEKIPGMESGDVLVVQGTGYER